MIASITDEERKYYALNRKWWPRLAPFYNLMVAPFSRLRDKVADVIASGNRLQVLDVATGTGKQAYAFARKGHVVTGVDLSPAMLKLASDGNRYANLQFRTGDATSLPFSEATFDVTSISFALHEMPASIIERVLAEMVRVTKPGGTLLLVDYGLPGNRVGRFLTYHIVKLWEGQSYARFLIFNLVASLSANGVIIQRDTAFLAGIARVVKATNPGLPSKPQRQGPQTSKRS